jgi:hypothetical protein
VSPLIRAKETINDRQKTWSLLHRFVELWRVFRRPRSASFPAAALGLTLPNSGGEAPGKHGSDSCRFAPGVAFADWMVTEKWRNQLMRTVTLTG